MWFKNIVIWVTTCSVSHCHTTVFICAVFIKYYEIFRNHANLWVQNRSVDIDRKKCYNLSHIYYVGTNISHLFICGLSGQTSQPDFLTILANVKETEKHKYCIFFGSFVFLIARIYICICYSASHPVWFLWWVEDFENIILICFYNVKELLLNSIDSKNGKSQHSAGYELNSKMLIKIKNNAKGDRPTANGQWQKLIPHISPSLYMQKAKKLYRNSIQMHFELGDNFRWKLSLLIVFRIWACPL